MFTDIDLTGAHFLPINKLYANNISFIGKIMLCPDGKAPITDSANFESCRIGPSGT